MAITRAQQAKQLLNKIAPKGERLAYINSKEAKLLKKMGGAGIDVNGTGIKSYMSLGNEQQMNENLSAAGGGPGGSQNQSGGGSDDVYAQSVRTNQRIAAERAAAAAKADREKAEAEAAFKENRFNYNRPNKVNKAILKAVSFMPTVSRLTGITPEYLNEQDEIASTIENLALGNYSPGSIGSQYFGPVTDAAVRNYKSTVGGFPTRDTGGGGDGDSNYVPPVYVPPITADTAAAKKEDEASPFTSQFTRAALTDDDKARINQIGGLSIFAANGGRIGYDMGGEVMDQELQAGAPEIKLEGNQIPQEQEMASAPNIDAELYQMFMDALRKGDVPPGTTFDAYKQLMMQMMSQQQDEQMQPEMQEGIMQASTMQPEREMAAYGGIMGADGRRAYGFGSFVKKAFKKAARAVKKVAKSPIGKAALLYAGGTYLGGTSLFSGPASAKYTGGNFFSTLGKRMANPGLLKRLYNPAFLQSTAGPTLSATPSVTAGLGAEEFARATYADQYNKLKALNPISKGNFVTNLFKDKATGAIDPLRVFAGITAAGAGAGLYTAKTAEEEESLDDILGARDTTKMDIAGIRKYIEDNKGQIDPSQYMALQKDYYKVAKGGRIGFAEGTKNYNEDPEYKGWKKMYEQNPGVAEMHDNHKTYLNFYNAQGKAEGGLMDLGGNEMDLRGGGFVPLGAQEKADDVPARLSKNEFVFTADAVRAAGGGSVDKGAEKMYNTMKRLEGVMA
jgi:hypothetical protein